MDYLTHHYKNLSEQLQAKVNHLHHLIRLSEENFAKPENGEKLDDYKGLDKQHAEELRYKQKQRKENTERSKPKVSEHETQNTDHESQHNTQKVAEKEIPKPKVKDNNKYKQDNNPFQPRNDKPKPIDSDDYDKAPKVKFKDENAKRAELSIKKPEPRREPGDSGPYDKGPIKEKSKFDVSNNRRTEI